tara:strand:- start:192 stop:353 length:162 start_codon:yes stop_codon:yes gene_type:complete
MIGAGILAFAGIFAFPGEVAELVGRLFPFVLIVPFSSAGPAPVAASGARAAIR